MAKYTGPKCKLSRRLGTDLMHKSGVRDFETKCKAKKPPGMHGDARKRTSDYGLQLGEKQKIRHFYGVLEKQFRNYYKKASSLKGSTAENLISLLESRLDNIIYRMGFAATRAEARQLVSHRAILVNETVVNIPSYHVSPGDVITIRQKARAQNRIQAAIALSEQRQPCDWISVDASAFSGTFNHYPTLEDQTINYNVNLVVELYSK